MKSFMLALAMLVAGFSVLFAGNNPKLVSGPMQGHTTTTSTKIWIMVKDAGIASVTLIDTLSGERYTTILKTEGLAIYEDFTPLIFDFNDLPTNKVYKVAITVDSESYDFDRLYYTAKTSKTDTYKFLVTSCALHVPFGLRLFHPGIEDRTYKFVKNTEADFNLWIGDYLYYFPKNYRSELGMTKRWVKTRQLKRLGSFTESMPQYSIWDDHEYGWNDADGTFPRKEHSLHLFKNFWANPAYGTEETPGCFFKFDYLDSEFFMLDDRYHRAQPNDSIPTMIGKGQLEWFKKNLKQSKAVFKFVAVGVQVFNQVTNHECYWHYKDELTEIVDFIKSEKIEGVIFLSGDRHHSELTKTEVAGGYPLYEFTSSGITSFRRRTRRTKENINPTRIEGTLADFQNYGRITIQGETGNRVCVMEIFNKRGKTVWTYSVNQNELKFQPNDLNIPVKLD